MDDILIDTVSKLKHALTDLPDGLPILVDVGHGSNFPARGRINRDNNSTPFLLIYPEEPF